MTIKKLEDIKQITVYLPEVEKWEIHNKADEYLRLFLKFMSFEDVELDSLESFNNEIVGKTANEFIQWLILKSDDEGYVLFDYLEYELGMFPDTVVDKYFYRNTEKEIPEDSDIFDDDEFQLANSQPYIGEDYFISKEEAVNHLCKEYPFYK